MEIEKHSNPSILFTVDVEDWFQVENFSDHISFNDWSSYDLRVEKNTHRLLDLLDSIRYSQPKSFLQKDISTSQHGANKTKSTKSYQHHNLCQKHYKPKATFFILGWIAEHLPNLVRQIHSRGHEVASHGYKHSLCNRLTYQELRNDLSKSKNILEDILGAPVFGYRAPSFSINSDVLQILQDCGYRYDSSLNSFSFHRRYGKLSLPNQTDMGIAFEISENFHELPISNTRIGNWFIPLGGGGYFRLFPFSLFKMGVQFRLKKDMAFLFYMHPWEIDPHQPKVNHASVFNKFKHYINLNHTYSNLTKFFEYFSYCRFSSCHQYLSEFF